MTEPRHHPPPEKSSEATDEQRRTRRAATKDRYLREQVKTEVEERPYLDTEGGE